MRGCEVGVGQTAELPLGHARRSWAPWGVWDPGPPQKKQEPKENLILPHPITTTRGWGGRLQAGVARQCPVVPQCWLDCQFILCGRGEIHGSPRASVSPSVKCGDWMGRFLAEKQK